MLASLEGLDWKPVSSVDFENCVQAEKLRRIRHSSAHLMAAVIQERYTDVQFATGPTTEFGFYYDLHFAEGAAFCLDDFVWVEERMRQIVAENQPFEVAEVTHEVARAHFDGADQHYKVQILDRISDAVVKLYRNGAFIDLCAGPHVPSTGHLAFFKLLNVSGAHWRDEREQSLIRVSGTAWSSAKEIKQYLRVLELVGRRDHRVRGPELDLFTFHPWAASALWHPKGLVLRQELDRMWRERHKEFGYVEIMNPMLYRPELYECSGHWDHFREDMFVFSNEAGEPSYALKPMNCPDTMLFFGSRVRSYRELPMRVAESQTLHRNEPSGSIHGIMRTRNFVQDDAHVFLATEHLQDEVSSQLRLIEATYSLFGLKFRLHLATQPEGSIGTDEVWRSAEVALRLALDATGRDYIEDDGEGAFYGPKIDVYVTDSLGRDWQCGTVQLDFNLPERFDLTYTASDGSPKRPIVIHRAVYGSIERFIGILIEHFDGLFPTWLAPEQAVVLPISSDIADYAQDVMRRLQVEGIRCELDEDGSLNYRIRAAEKRRVRYVLVVGERERESNTVAVRLSGEARRETMGLEQLVEELLCRISERVLDVTVNDLMAGLRQPESGSGEQDY